MKEWIVCKYGPYHVQDPITCQPIGLAFQKQEGDPAHINGFVSMTDFEKWLIANDLCAFGPSYKGMKGNKTIWPTVYPVQKSIRGEA